MKIKMNVSRTTEEVFETYLIHCEAKGLSAKTIKSYRQQFYSLRKYLNITLPIEQLSKQAGNEQAAHGHRDPQNQPAQPPKQTPIIHILKSFPQRHPACGGSLDELAYRLFQLLASSSSAASFSHSVYKWASSSSSFSRSAYRSWSFR